jgi:hypothetical protein
MARNDKQILDQIAMLLQEPEWGPGMLEDIETLVRRTGRDVDGDGESSTWLRH